MSSKSEDTPSFCMATTLASTNSKEIVKNGSTDYDPPFTSRQQELRTWKAASFYVSENEIPLTVNLL